MESGTFSMISEHSNKYKINKEINIISVHPSKMIRVNTDEKNNSKNNNLRLISDIQSQLTKARHKITTEKTANKQIARKQLHL